MPAVKRNGHWKELQTLGKLVFSSPSPLRALGRRTWGEPGGSTSVVLCHGGLIWTHFLPSTPSPVPELVAGQSSYWRFFLDCWMAMFRALRVSWKALSCVIFFHPLPSPRQGCYLHSKTEKRVPEG